MVFFMNDKLNDKIEKLLLGLASGVMIAASIWSLLIPSMELSEESKIITWIPATVGFVLGIFSLSIIDYIILYFEKNTQNKSMLTLAVTIHNIPEGMAVGVAFSSFILGESNIALASAMALSIGIAIQNFPEGAIISLPLKCKGESKLKSFGIGVLSGIVEPISALITIILASFVTPILPYFLAFAAGAMMYVVIEELIPESR